MRVTSHSALKGFMNSTNAGLHKDRGVFLLLIWYLLLKNVMQYGRKDPIAPLKSMHVLKFECRCVSASCLASVTKERDTLT